MIVIRDEQPGDHADPAPDTTGRGEAPVEMPQTHHETHDDDHLDEIGWG